MKTGQAFHLLPVFKFLETNATTKYVVFMSFYDIYVILIIIFFWLIFRIFWFIDA